MRKLFFILFLFAATQANAQKFSIGLKAGGNLSNFTGGDFDQVSKKALLGFHAGLYSRFKFINFAIQAEAMVSTQGARIDSVSGSYDWKLTYINVPVMAQLYLPGGFYVETGPQVGFQISKEMGNQTINDFIQDLDLSIAAGLGYRFKGLGFGARYTAGISKLGKAKNSSNINPDFKNSVIQASIYIPLSK